MGQFLKVEGRIGGGRALRDFDNHLEIRLPDWRILRLVARSMFLALAVVSFLTLGINLSPPPAAGKVAVSADLAHNNADVADSAAVGGTTADGLLRSMDDVFFLPMLFRDLKRQGLLRPGDRSVFLGDANPRLLRLLRQNNMDLITGRGGDDRHRRAAPDSAVDFLFSNGFRDPEFIDGVLKVGGVAAVRLSSDPSIAFRMPSNYRTVYIRRFGSTVVAMRKVGQADAAADSAVVGPQRRRLLAVPDAKKEALNGLEDVLLEPPRTPSSAKWSPDKYLRRTRYLPELTGDTLDGYPRRVFVDVVGRHGKGHGDGGDGARWFARNYPTRGRDFETIRVETETGGEKAVPAAGDGMSGWLRRNVREEEYVVMKADSEVVEEMVRSRAIELVDELFLECRHYRGERKGGGGDRRAYWECLALYGRLWDAGVAVHQWWWS